jgi:hypothetical protein
VFELLQNPQLRRDISNAAHEQMETAHKWPSSMQILDSVLETG